MSVKLLYASPLYLIANAIRYSHYNHDKSDSYLITNNLAKCTCPDCGSKNIQIIMLFGDDQKSIKCQDCEFILPIEKHIGYKDYDLIKRIGFHLHHDSVLEHSMLSFHIPLSTKALLEDTRHRIGIGRTVVSSRYALKVYKIRLEKNDNDWCEDKLQNVWKPILEEGLQKVINKEIKMDDFAMMLPQAFIYEMEETFNLRSLIHYLNLRLTSAAHKTIRKVAFKILRQIELKEPLYFNLLMEIESIRKNYEKFKKEF